MHIWKAAVCWNTQKSCCLCICKGNKRVWIVKKIAIYGDLCFIYYNSVFSGGKWMEDFAYDWQQEYFFCDDVTYEIY